MKCKICNNELNNTRYTVREMMLGLRDEFEYFQCNDCGCLQISEIPEDIHKYYPENYCCHAIPTISKIRDIVSHLKDNYILHNDDYISKFLDKNIPCKYMPLMKAIKCGDITPASSVLDVGCGTGEILKFLQQFGFRDLVGIDPFIRNEYYPGIKTYRCDISGFRDISNDGSYDFIILNHSFEHMPNPKEVLEDINKLLSRTGTCMIRIPTVSSRAWQVYRENWVQLDAPRHFFLHSIESMKRLCQDTGFKIVDLYYDSAAFQFIGSEQYLRDISLYDKNSYYTSPRKSKFTRTAVAKFKREANELNLGGSGDQITMRIKRNN